MDKESLFRWLSNALKDTPVAFLEVYVGDEKDGQVYVLFENLEEEDNGN